MDSVVAMVRLQQARVGVLDDGAPAVLADGVVGLGRQVAILHVKLLQGRAAGDGR